MSGVCAGARTPTPVGLTRTVPRRPSFIVPQGGSGAGRGADHPHHGLQGGGEGAGGGEAYLDAEGSGAVAGGGRMRRASSVMAMASSAAASRALKAHEDLDSSSENNALPAGAAAAQGGSGSTLEALTRSLAKIGGGQVRILLDRSDLTCKLFSLSC